jgi:hypothetical protein
MTLLSAPLELGGEWGGSPPNDALAVISRMREVCLRTPGLPPFSSTSSPNGISSKGLALGFADTVIGATARTRQLIILTRNIRHFAPLAILTVNPFQELPA